jgi:hypothetical protein
MKDSLGLGTYRKSAYQYRGVILQLMSIQFGRVETGHRIVQLQVPQ